MCEVLIFFLEMQHKTESSVNSSIAIVEAKYNKILSEKEKQLKEFIQKHNEVSIYFINLLKILRFSVILFFNRINFREMKFCKMLLINFRELEQSQIFAR